MDGYRVIGVVIVPLVRDYTLLEMLVVLPLCRDSAYHVPDKRPSFSHGSLVGI